MVWWSLHLIITVDRFRGFIPEYPICPVLSCQVSQQSQSKPLVAPRGMHSTAVKRKTDNRLEFLSSQTLKFLRILTIDRANLLIWSIVLRYWNARLLHAIKASDVSLMIFSAPSLGTATASHYKKASAPCKIAR